MTTKPTCSKAFEKKTLCKTGVTWVPRTKGLHRGMQQVSRWMESVEPQM